MKDREINVPKALQELHGEKSMLSTIIMVYFAGIIAASVFIFALLPLKLPVWKYILIAVLMIDIAGGVVANLSTPTNQYYQKNRKLRIVFLSLHFIQPLVFFIIFPDFLAFFVFLFIYTIACAIIVNAFKNKELQQNIAAIFVVAGVVLTFLFKIEPIILYSVAPLFMTKLILGFSVKRPVF